jgi:hypothetical protein
MDTFATIPAPALTRLHQDPEEPGPFVSDTALLDELPSAAIDELLALAGPGSGSPLMMVELRQVGGALRRPAPGHGAAAGINGDFVLFAGSLAFDADMAAMMKGYAGRIIEAMQPWANRGHYLNFAEHRVDVADTYGTKAYRRLVAVKTRLDPNNAIHANHAIAPAR